jgi:hypothetical protein
LLDEFDERFELELLDEFELELLDELELELLDEFDERFELELLDEFELELLDEFELELLDELELEFELLLDELPPRIRFSSSTWLGAHAAPPRMAAAPSVKALTCQGVRRFFGMSTPLSGNAAFCRSSTVRVHGEQPVKGS